MKTSTLILIAFATAFFPRIIDFLGAPPTINFLHFIVVPVALVAVLFKSKIRDKLQSSIVKNLLIGLCILLVVMIISALLNGAGVINVVLDFLLLAEPFMLLLAVVSIDVSGTSALKLRNWLYFFALINLVLAFAQYPLLLAGALPTNGMGIEDSVQGVFFITGAGNYVSATVSMCIALYFYASVKNIPRSTRTIVLLVAFYQILLSDSKQILLTFIIAWALLPLIGFLKNAVKALKYIAGFIIFAMALLWCVQNLEAFAGFNSWARPELYAADGEGTQAKLAGVFIIISYYTSPLNWLFGLGPGHTIGRLGGWMLKDYWSLLGPLGATKHPASDAVWDAVNGNWLNSSGGSTFFSPFFGWAGIWGDLGFLGLAAYLFLTFIVWRYICVDDLSKFWLLTIFVIGLIFTQIEEPGYMLTMSMLFGLRWQEYQSRSREKANTMFRLRRSASLENASN